MTVAASYTAFAEQSIVASGDLHQIAVTVKVLVEQRPEAQILIFDDRSGAQVDMNFNGPLEQVLQRLPAARPVAAAEVAAGPAARAPGRPKLGVVGREVTLLPRHWEWLNGQPGGASVALRKLVEQAQRVNKDADQQRAAREAGYKFISAMAGDQAGYEEACRALFAGNEEKWLKCMATWPQDVRQQAQKMAQASFGGADDNG